MRKFATFIQPNAMDCGPACLKIITKYYSKDWSISHLRQISETTRIGSNLSLLATAAETIGLRSLPVRVTLNKLLTEQPFPCIIHWKQSHFVVLYKLTSTHAFVSDPAIGLVKYPHKEFLRYWINKNANETTEEGIALLLEPTIKFYETEPIKDENLNSAINRFFGHYLVPHKRVIVFILISLLLGTLIQLAIPYLTQNIVDLGITNKDINFVWLVLMAQLMLMAGQLSLEWFRTWCFLTISNRMNLSLISDFFLKLMRLPINFFDVRLSGDLMQRIQDHSRVQAFLTSGSLSIVFSVFTFILYGCMLCYYNIMLFEIFLVGSLMYVLWISIFLKRRAKLDFKRFQESGATTSKVIEIINGMQEIKLHNAEKQKRWAWERMQIRLYKVGIQSVSLEQLQSIGSRVINELKNICITAAGANLVIQGKLTLGMMLAISYIIGQLNTPVLQFVGIIKGWQDAKLSLSRLLEIHTKEEESAINSVKVPKDNTITIKNLSFKYNSCSDDVLKNINLVIPQKKVTAIVGSSGSGKTTLMKLLLSFYPPTEGIIKIGEVDLNQIDVFDLRNNSGVVMQEGYLFNDTIAGNIALGTELPDMERLIFSAKLSNIFSFVESLPLKFNTQIGSEGIGISTGQKQRILIARAIYKNPNILLFDEATSSLDANNEKEIMENLEEFYKEKTVVVIAHRLSTVKNAHNIIVLDSGSVVEEGTHLELIAQKGYYYSLVKNQLELGN